MAGFSGLKHSDETRAKMRASHKGMSGRTHSAETRAKMSAAARSGPLGYTHTEEHNTKIAQYHADHPGFNQTPYPSNLEQALELLLQDAGLEYEAQKHFGRYVVDFYVPSHGLAFEADGSYWHKDKEREVQRDAYLLERGVIAVHLNEQDLINYLQRSTSNV